MRTWTVHLRDGKPPVLLVEGFAWWAWLLGPLWLALHGAWIPAGLALALYAMIAVFADGPTGLALGLAANWALGLWGQDLRRWSLGLRGYVLGHVVAARDADGAFVRLLSVRPDLGDLFLPHQDIAAGKG